MKESIIQSKIIKRFEAEGFYVIKLIQSSKNGVPDLLLLKNSEAVFIECKSEKGKLSELQKFRKKELEKMGFKVYVTSDPSIIL